MAKAKKENDDKQPIIIIKRIKRAEGGHHGGSWKVAYADFVTSMMAFFLLLWLLSVTTPEQKRKIADYFSPTDPRISQSVNGSNGLLAGSTISPDGSLSEITAQLEDNPDITGEENKFRKETEEMDKKDEKSFKDTEQKIREAVESSPDLKELQQNLLMDITPEGMRIQIVDQEGRPMFALGSPVPLPHTEKLISVIAGTLKDLPNKISVRGHTDSKQYGREASYTNWELSADRANASRRILVGAALDIARLENVQGRADRELMEATPADSPRQRRISIVLLRQSLTLAAKRTEEKFKNKKPEAERPAGKKREEGVIYFP